MKLVLGLDVGYGNTKLAWGSANATNPQTLVMPSGSAPIWSLPVLPNGQRDLCGGVPVLVNGEDWVAGVESHRLENFTREHSGNYTDSKEWLAMVHAALVRVGSPRVDVVVAGLPVTEFFEGATRRDILRSRLEGVHHVAHNQTVEVVKAIVVPQPIGAFADHVYAAGFTGEKPPGPDHMSLVIDPGHYSADWVIIQGDKSIRQRSSSNSKQAGRETLVQTGRLIFEQTGLRVSHDRLEAAVRRQEQEIEIGNIALKLAPYFEKAGATVVDQVLKEVKASVGADQDAINTVILTGGGAPLYAPLVSRVMPRKRLVQLQEPILGNARGFWSTGKSVR